MNIHVSKNSKPKSIQMYTKLFAQHNNKNNKKKIHVQAGGTRKTPLRKFHKNILFIDPNPGFNVGCYRLLYGSYLYKKPKWIFPIDSDRQRILNVELLQFNSNQDGSIYYFPSHTYGFYACWNSKDCLKNIKCTIKLLLTLNRQVIVKLHPGDKKRLKHINDLEKCFPSVTFPKEPFIDINSIKPYACVVDGGGIVVKLAMLGYPLFCFNKYRKFFLSKFATSNDISLLKKELKETMFPSRNDFLNLVCSHTFTRTEISKGVVHNLLKKTNL